MFLQGRDWLKARFEAAGLTTRIDAAGNLIGRRAGTKSGAGTIVIGSHSDTVPSGGRFDGTAGVLAGVEIARVLQEAGHDLDHDLEIIDCLAEEVSAFGISCVGSRAIAGILTHDMLAYEGPGGERLAEAIVRMGGDPSRLADARRSDIAAYLELHIEQGPVLETEHIDVGIVETIAGITRLELTIAGRADSPVSGSTAPIRMLRAKSLRPARIISLRPPARSTPSRTPRTWCRRGCGSSSMRVRNGARPWSALSSASKARCRSLSPQAVWNSPALQPSPMRHRRTAMPACALPSPMLRNNSGSRIAA